MDGASKFVKDAIAGLIITVINILGGIAIGVFQRDMPLEQALGTYSLLTVGTGWWPSPPPCFVHRHGDHRHPGGGEATWGGTWWPPSPGTIAPCTSARGFSSPLAVVPGLPTLPFGLLGVGLALMAGDPAGGHVQEMGGGHPRRGSLGGPFERRSSRRYPRPGGGPHQPGERASPAHRGPHGGGDRLCPHPPGGSLREETCWSTSAPSTARWPWIWDWW